MKWAGGKSQLAEEIFRAFPQTIFQNEKLTFVEPFVGGGAILFRILSSGIKVARSVINDINPALSETYRCVRDNAEKLVGELTELQTAYFSLPQEGEARREFFLARRAEFNALTVSSNGNVGRDEIRVPALMVFLNRTCFNGLFRVNAHGEFNVPFGKYKNPKICDAETLRSDSRLLQSTEILCGDFEETLKFADGNAIFYLDPPYKPISETSSFNAYAQGGFDDAEQVRLRNFCGKLHERGARWVLSNSDACDATGTPFFDKLYAGFNIRRVLASRMVNANPAKRGKLSEVLISNF